MSFEQKVEQHHVIQYQAMADIAYQQVATRARFVCDEMPVRGTEAAIFHEFGKVKAQRLQGRLQTNLDNVAERRRRFIQYDSEYGTGEHLDEETKWRQAMDAQSLLLQTHTSAIARFEDYTVLAGALGPAYSGKFSAATKHTLGAANTIDVGVGAANSGLNIQKIIAIRKAFGLNNADIDASMRPQMFITWRQMEDLLKIDELRRTDSGVDAASVQRTGKLSGYMGIDFTVLSDEVWADHEEPEPNTFWKDSSTKAVRYCPVIMPRSVTMAVWQERRSRMWNDTSKRLIPVMEVSINIAAARNRDEGVLRVECKE